MITCDPCDHGHPPADFPKCPNCPYHAPKCYECGKSDKVVRQGPEMIGSEFHCERCNSYWVQES